MKFEYGQLCIGVKTQVECGLSRNGKAESFPPNGCNTVFGDIFGITVREILMIGRIAYRWNHRCTPLGVFGAGSMSMTEVGV
jgi:hypothetical protein